MRELLGKVREVGGDLDGVVHRAGLPHAAGKLLDPAWHGQLSRDEFALLYAECTWALDAHAARQEGRAPLTKPELDMLWYCVITCATLREVIARTAAFSAMLAPRLADLTLEVADGEAVFRMAVLRTRRNVSAYVSDLTGLSMHHRMFGWLIGEDIELPAVEVRYPPLLSEEASARLMPAPITYGAPENALRFPARYLDQPVVRSYAELVRLLERFPFDLEETHSVGAPLSERVRVILGAALAQQKPLPTSVELAGQFSISPATLKRHLAEEGASLVRLKEASRRDLAQRLLVDAGLAVGEIAMRLGFSDTTTFSRAFKQWTGHSPARWRLSGETTPQPQAAA